MGVGELLDQVRQYYLDRLIAAAEKKARGKTSSVVLEPAFRNRDGIVAVAGDLQLALRKDIAIVRNGEVKELLTVDTKGMLTFDPIAFDWGDGLRVSMGPFQWQQMPFRVPRRKAMGWQPLQDWFWRWFRQDDDGGEDGLLGVVHFLSDPEVSGKSVAFEADLGSAPVEAFEELLDAIATLGAKRCEIGQLK
jgi:hypothetical protein